MSRTGTKFANIIDIVQIDIMSLNELRERRSCGPRVLPIVAVSQDRADAQQNSADQCKEPNSPLHAYYPLLCRVASVVERDETIAFVHILSKIGYHANQSLWQF